MSEDFERVTREAPVIRPDRAHETLSEVDLAALQHRQHLGTKRVDQSYLNVGISLRVGVQEICKHAFDVARCGCDLQNAGVFLPKRLRPLAYRAGVGQEVTAVAQQLLALTSQH